jgi:ribosomal protein S3
VTLKHLKVKSLKDIYFKKDAKFIKEKLNLKLYKYKRNEFFEIAKRVIFISIKKKNSAQFLANFISSQLNRLKKQQYFFLKCIKNIFKLLLGNVLRSTKLFGIKIVVKGRLNKARRANKRTFKLSIGKISLQQINSNINHAKATSYTSSGTFGTEVWINYLKKMTNKKVFKKSRRSFKKKKLFNIKDFLKKKLLLKNYKQQKVGIKILCFYNQKILKN